MDADQRTAARAASGNALIQPRVVSKVREEVAGSGALRRQDLGRPGRRSPGAVPGLAIDPGHLV
jgi:hypothetical protein